MSVHISRDLVLGPAEEDFPLTHARIGWRNIAREDGVLTATSTAPDFSILALQNDFTNEVWRSIDIDATLTLDAGRGRQVDFVGIAGHNLGDTGHAIAVEYSLNNVNWVTLDEFTVPDNSPIMSLFQELNARYWRVRLQGGNAPPQIAIFSLGRALQMQRPIYGGHGPITLNRSITKREQITESGQFIGNIVVRRGVSTSFSWDNLTAAWYRQFFDPFAVHSLVSPFFIAWRPASFPREIAFCMATDQPRPQNTGTRDLMSVSMSVRGLAA